MVNLSNTWCEILDLLPAAERCFGFWRAQGLSNKEIGAHLNLSPFTIKNHLVHVFEKLQVRCRTEAVMTYLQAAPGAGGPADFSAKI